MLKAVWLIKCVLDFRNTFDVILHIVKDLNSLRKRKELDLMELVARSWPVKQGRSK